MIDLAVSYGLRITIFRTDNNIIEERAASGLLADLWEFAEERAGIKQYIAGLSRSEAEREAGALACTQREL